MAWWTRIVRADGKVEIEKHEDRQPKLGAMIKLNYAHHLGGVPLEKLGLYKRDPEKYPDEPNVLEKEQQKRFVAEVKAIMKKPRRKG